MKAKPLNLIKFTTWRKIHQIKQESKNETGKNGKLKMFNNQFFNHTA
jgi:hypothetical protein